MLDAPSSAAAAADAASTFFMTASLWVGAQSLAQDSDGSAFAHGGQCVPMETVIAKAKAYLDARSGERVTLGELAGAVGASPFHLQRRFKQALGVSPRGYQDARRVEAVKSSLKNGRRVTDALYDAGYGSASRFYENPPLGMNARDYRAHGKGQRIAYTCFPTPLGMVLIGATEKGQCSVKLREDATAQEGLLARELHADRRSEEGLRGPP